MATMPERFHFGFAGGAFFVVDGNFEDFITDFGRAKQQVKITPFINAHLIVRVIFFKERFGAAQGVGEILFNQERHEEAKNFITEEV